jgi:hypothetical protein
MIVLGLRLRKYFFVPCGMWLEFMERDLQRREAIRLSIGVQNRHRSEKASPQEGRW